MAPTVTLTPDAEVVLRTIRTRRSYPFCRDEAPPREVIDTLLEAASYAPNHHLTQPWRFCVFRGDARLRLGEAVAEAGLARWPAATPAEAAARRRNVPQSFLRAPVVIAVAAAPPPADGKTPPWEELAATAAAIQSMLLAAHAMGLAAYWRSNGTGLDGVREFLGLEPESQVVGFVYVGYPDPDRPLIDKPRRPHADFVRWIGWDDG